MGLGMSFSRTKYHSSLNVAWHAWCLGMVAVLANYIYNHTGSASLSTHSVSSRELCITMKKIHMEK